MRFAINYSPQAAGLVLQGAIDIDLFKCPTASDPVVREHLPSLIDDARLVRPVYVHFPFSLPWFPMIGAEPSPGDVDWAEVDDVLGSTETQFVNVHLAAKRSDFPDIAIDSVERADLRRITDAFVDGVNVVADRYGAARVIVENVVYSGTGGKYLRAGIEPEVIRSVVEGTGCGLLLDLAHARLTCHHLGIEVRQYISKLPTSTLRELHVTGTGRPPELRDSLPMETDDWSLFDWVSERILKGEWPTPWAVAFEYGGIGPVFDWRSDADVIATQVPRLHRQFR